MNELSNILALLTAFFELFLFSGTVFGFSFLEYIWKKELILYDEQCDPDKVRVSVIIYMYNQW